MCSTKKINGIWSKTFNFGYSIFVTDFMGLLLHPVYVFWCISAYFNGYIDLKRDNGVTPPVSGLKSKVKKNGDAPRPKQAILDSLGADPIRLL